ncbi:PglD-related sugar-binding protein [Methylobacterium radiotolerans]|uniref:PglD-related sugar-binding protein n=1 Tax=Methylobacterium radiotolerans TaxID=31998 RepID=UPI000D5ECE89|nr:MULTISPECIES: acetyltransferase [Methylobacterium]MDE3749502.1 acetyltransferase [Methylobacterium radiotolerans]PVY94256.1 sugar O-acyltransferase (sialic acid O-acetyltransferase NeuD family) [Methylobacterium organophilum]
MTSDGSSRVAASNEKRLALIGGGGFGKEVAEIARLNGFTVQAVYSTQKQTQVAPWRGYLDELLADRDQYEGVAIAIGGVTRQVITARADIIAWLFEHEFTCPPLISPRATVCDGVTIEPGVFVAHGVILNVDAHLSAFCMLNSAAIVGHDARIGRNATVSPGAFIGGKCSVGAGTLIGPLAKVLQGLRIGENVTIGMGCNVMRDVQDGAVLWPRPDIVGTS